MGNKNSVLVRSGGGQVYRDVKPEGETEKERSAKQLNVHGRRLFDSKKYRWSLHFFNLALKLCPSSANYYSNRSAVHYKLGNFTEAMTDAESCVNCRPDWAKGYYRLGKALLALDEYDRAEACLSEGWRLLPFNRDITRLLQFVSEGQDVQSFPVAKILRGEGDSVCIASRYVRKGETILRCAPIAGVVRKAYLKTHCSHCFQRFRVNKTVFRPTSAVTANNLDAENGSSKPPRRRPSNAGLLPPGADTAVGVSAGTVEESKGPANNGEKLSARNGVHSSVEYEVDSDSVVECPACKCVSFCKDCANSPYNTHQPNSLICNLLKTYSSMSATISPSESSSASTSEVSSEAKGDLSNLCIRFLLHLIAHIDFYRKAMKTREPPVFQVYYASLLDGPEDLQAYFSEQTRTRTKLSMDSCSQAQLQRIHRTVAYVTDIVMNCEKIASSLTVDIEEYTTYLWAFYVHGHPVYDPLTDTRIARALYPTAMSLFNASHAERKTNVRLYQSSFGTLCFDTLRDVFEEETFCCYPPIVEADIEE